jgi:phosphohistidine swiveling domain-containing protein
MSVQKKKYMEVTRKPTNNKMLNFDDQEYERVKEFKYLATIVTEENDITTGIE